MEREMERAIAGERYERAAELRDAICLQDAIVVAGISDPLANNEFNGGSD
jgi:hypothetical protein